LVAAQAVAATTESTGARVESRRLRELMNEWVGLAVERERAERAEEKHHRGD